MNNDLAGALIVARREKFKRQQEAHYMRLLALSTDELQAHADQLAADLNRINAQLQEARGNVRVSGIYSDTEWYRKANTARSIKGQEHQFVLREIGKRRRTENAQRQGQDSVTFERAFMATAKEYLSAQQFGELLALTRANIFSQQKASGSPEAF